MAVSLGSLAVDVLCRCWREGEVTMGSRIRFKPVVSLVLLEPDLPILSSA